jgi:hypothetical protein
MYIYIYIILNMLVIKILATNTIHKAIKLQITAYSLYILSRQIIPVMTLEESKF